jgi:hypothetical protein
MDDEDAVELLEGDFTTEDVSTEEGGEVKAWPWVNQVCVHAKEAQQPFRIWRANGIVL